MRREIEIQNKIKKTLTIFGGLVYASFSITSCVDAKSDAATAVYEKNYALPKGYYSELTSDRCESDFDNDGEKDLAIFCKNEGQSLGRVCIYLSSRYTRDKPYFWFPWTINNMNGFEYGNNILTISNEVGFGSNATITLKLRYYKKLENMRLIGLEDYWTEGMQYILGEWFNFLNGEVTTNEMSENGKLFTKIVKKRFDVITLSDIQNYPNFLKRFDNR